MADRSYPAETDTVHNANAARRKNLTRRDEPFLPGLDPGPTPDPTSMPIGTPGRRRRFSDPGPERPWEPAPDGDHGDTPVDQERDAAEFAAAVRAPPGAKVTVHVQMPRGTAQAAEAFLKAVSEAGIKLAGSQHSILQTLLLHLNGEKLRETGELIAWPGRENIMCRGAFKISTFYEGITQLIAKRIVVKEKMRIGGVLRWVYRLTPPPNITKNRNLGFQKCARQIPENRNPDSGNARAKFRKTGTQQEEEPEEHKPEEQQQHADVVAVSCAKLKKVGVKPLAVRERLAKSYPPDRIDTAIKESDGAGNPPGFVRDFLVYKWESKEEGIKRRLQERRPEHIQEEESAGLIEHRARQARDVAVDRAINAMSEADIKGVIAELVEAASSLTDRSFIENIVAHSPQEHGRFRDKVYERFCRPPAPPAPGNG